MNKNRFTEFFKGKGYYVLLFVGVLAIAAVAIVGSQLSSNKKEEGEDYVNLNDTEDNIAADEDDEEELAEYNPVSEGIANLEDNSAEDIVAKDESEAIPSNSDQVEYEDYTDATVNNGPPVTKPATKETPKEDESKETAGKAVEVETASVADNLTFNKEKDTLLWPVNGNVIMNYSMDHTIYFATLMQYKCNPAIIIDADVGTEVKAAAKGVVASIDPDNEETGFTITMNIGGGYSLVYGQLDKDSVSLEVGDMVEEGDVIGTIGNPTKYYSVEGSNLYFQVLEDEQTVNPMLLLR